MPERTCDKCNFTTPVKCNWERHLLTEKHLKNCVIITQAPLEQESIKEGIPSFHCQPCMFSCKTKSNYTRHLETVAHKTRFGLNSAASIVTQNIVIQEDILQCQSSQVLPFDIRLILKNSKALDMNDHINKMLQENKLSMFKYIETESHGRLITLTNIDSMRSMVVDGLGYHVKVFSELFTDPKTNPIICNNLEHKECRFKIGDEWKTQTLSTFLTKDHTCETCKTTNHEFVPTCKKCMSCVRERKPEFAHLGGYEIDSLISEGVSPYDRTYKVTSKTFKENIIHFHSCCLRGMITNFSQLALYALWNTFMLHKCGELQLSKNELEYETQLMVSLSNLANDLLDTKERQLFKSLYTILCEMCPKE